jgi:hypothetical protein
MTDQVSPMQQMLRQIQFYRRNNLSLGALIGDLEFLANSITDQSESWKRSVCEEIGDLEQVNAVMLDRGMQELDETGRMIVDNALRELTLLVSEAGQRE